MVLWPVSSQRSQNGVSDTFIEEKTTFHTAITSVTTVTTASIITLGISHSCQGCTNACPLILTYIQVDAAVSS